MTEPVTEPAEAPSTEAPSTEAPPAGATAAAAAPTPPEEPEERGRWWWVPGATTVLVILGVMAVTLWQLHFHLLFTDTTTTGGDTGAHVALPAYLQSLLKHGHLSGWDPGWYDGFSLYTFYFALPDVFAAIGGWIIPYNIAFKLVTILGSMLLPLCAWACGRLFRLRPPIPTILAAITLPYLFDYTYTIYGGNLFSTLAGEYAYSFSLSLAILFLGLFSRVVREGTHRAWASIVLAVCVLSHIIPGMLALAGAAVLVAIELLPPKAGFHDDQLVPYWDWKERPPGSDRFAMLWRSGTTVAIGLLLTGWWLVPFGLSQSYATSMGYSNVTSYLPTLFPEADAWVLGLAGVAIVAVCLLKSRFGFLFTVLGAASAFGLVLDPQGKLYNVRLLPLWFICVYLMAGWVIGVAMIVAARWWRRWQIVDAPPDPADAVQLVTAEGGKPVSWPWPPAAVGGALFASAVIFFIVVAPFIFPANDLPVTPGGNEVTNWSSTNYNGYQELPAYPEYSALMDTMKRMGRRYGCGRAMWEYNADEGRFGTTEALMLLPYWTGGCIDSMEGLLFESSATTPYHFIDQAELSVAPSDPEVGLPYGPLDVTLGVQHLQLLGVKYFMAESVEVEDEANVDPDLKLIATTGPWTNGAGTTTWDIYEVEHSALVTPLTHQPVIEKGIKPAASSWLMPSLNWYDTPADWKVELAQSGPSSWPEAAIGAAHPTAVRVPTTKVTDTRVSDTSISFHVSRLGTPVLVKISYFPNWRATGATGPYRVTPNLMVVIPTSHDVSLHYDTTNVDRTGDAATAIGLVALLAVIAWPRVRRRRARTAGASAELAG